MLFLTKTRSIEQRLVESKLRMLLSFSYRIRFDIEHRGITSFRCLVLFNILFRYYCLEKIFIRLSDVEESSIAEQRGNSFAALSRATSTLGIIVEWKIICAVRVDIVYKYWNKPQYVLRGIHRNGGRPRIAFWPDKSNDDRTNICMFPYNRRWYSS